MGPTIFPRSQGVREDRGAPGTYADAEAMERFFAAMQHEHFDLAVQLHGGGRHSNPFTLRLGARISVGLRTPDAQPLDRWVPYIYFQPEILRCLEVVSLAGAPRLDLEPHLAVTQADLDESCDVVAAAPGTESAPLVVLHPGAGDGRRQWPPEKFAAVGDSLAEAGARIVISGTDPERSLVRAVCTTMLGAAQDACGALSLGGLTGLLSRCSLVVANDSGPLHLAEATGAATVGIYWCGNLINAEPITRTRHRPHLSWRLDCPVCGRNCIDDNCDHHASFVADVPVDEVTASALSLLAAPHRPGQAQGQADSVSFGADWGHDGQPKGDRRDP